MSYQNIHTVSSYLSSLSINLQEFFIKYLMHFNNRQRVLRAIEIFEISGKKKSEILEQQQHILLYDACFIGLTLNRDVLYERINHRVDIMDERGLEQEVKSLYNKGYTRNMQSMKAIGYKEWFDYYDGALSKEEVLEKIKKNSRNYAKRQYTWFKNQFDMNWFDVNLNDFHETVEEVLKLLKKRKVY